MTKLTLKYTRPVKSKGKVYWYYRRDGVQQRIEGTPGSIEFMENYQRIHDSFQQGVRKPGIIPYSVEALIRDYYASAEYKRLGERAKAEYRSYLEPFREKRGDKPVRLFKRKHFLEIRDRLHDTPSKADHVIKVLRVLFSFAVDREWIEANPLSRIKKLTKSDGWTAWPTQAIQRAQVNLTGAPRTAFMLALYTGQRKGDVLAMQWNAIDDNGIHVKQSKTGKPVWVPLHPALAEELSKLKRNGIAIVARRDGKPLTISGFNRMWRRQQDKHDFKGLQFHGLRRNAVNALLEAGCEIAEVSAITGQSFEMVQHYAQEVNQKRLAESAMNKWQTSSGKLIGKLKVKGASHED